jgi:RNA polymerase sigma factor (sigma-70 family)
MRIIEVLLQQRDHDRSLSPQVIKQIDVLKSEMAKIVRDIHAPGTSPAGRDMLITQLRDKKYELDNLVPHIDLKAESIEGIPEGVIHDRIKLMQIRNREAKEYQQRLADSWRRGEINYARLKKKLENPDLTLQQRYDLTLDFWDASKNIGIDFDKTELTRLNNLVKAEKAEKAEKEKEERKWKWKWPMKENDESEQFEVFDIKTKEKVSGPYATRKRARAVADKKDLEYGAIRYGVRPIKKLGESINSPGEFRWVHTGNRDAMAYFDVGDIDYTFNAQSNSRGDWVVKFDANHEDGSGTTGTGNAPQVFSTVVKILKDFESKYADKINRIIFFAASPTRSSIYRRIFQLPGYTTQENTRDGSTTFTLTPKDKKVSEAYPKQQLTLYKPDGETYRGQPMPTLGTDPVNDADSIDTLRNTPGEDDFIDPLSAKREVEKYMDRLTEREQQVMKLRYWEGLTFEEVGNDLGVSAGRAQQMEAKIFRKIKYFKLGDERHSFNVRNHHALKEAVHKIPITTEDFDAVKELMNFPIPAAIARIYLQDCIDDDAFNDELQILEDTEPARDVRPLIAEWFERVMPDQMFHFRDDKKKGDLNQKQGILSPIHGYDPHVYKGTNDPITGDAYGYV